MTQFLKYLWLGLLVLITLVILSLRYNQATPVAQTDASIFQYSTSLLPQAAEHTQQVVVITLDEQALLESTPSLSRKEALAQLLHKIGKTKPQSVALMQPLEHLTFQAELDVIQKLETTIQATSLTRQERQGLKIELQRMSELMNVDQRLIHEIKKLKYVFLPFTKHGETALPSFVKTYPIQHGETQNETMETISSFLAPSQAASTEQGHGLWPHASYGEAAYGVGYLSSYPSATVVPSVQLIQPYHDGMLVSLPLMIAAHAQGIALETLRLDKNKTLLVGNTPISLDVQNFVFPRYYEQAGEDPVFKVYDYKQLMSGKIPVSNLEDKIVLIDVLSAQSVEPVAVMNSDTEMVAQTVASILNQDTYSHPNAMLWLEVMLFMLVGVYVLFILPRLSFTTASFISLLLLLSILGLETYLLLREQLWLYSGASLLLLLTGYLVLVVRYFFFKQQAMFAADIYQANRQLGLLLQAQGQLEQAFECYQKLSSEDEDLGLMYNLALDFERKRKFNNAAAAFQYILQYQPNFKDVPTRAIQAQQMQQTITLGTGNFHNLGSLLEEGKGEKPMLGRFVIERELGKGAMGAVYLGRDPKIDRVVAVKTLALAQEFDSTEIKEVEQRFFHEASAAGRLNHPHIVTIYDAAEEHDLAYIAMEYIEGDSLDAFVKKEQLLPAITVLKIIAKIADGLEYAGKQGIVHRDIKPANIMFNEAKNVVKITDFGIARISSSGKTKTGMILGTPSFMSPEQMSGAKVDLRSDIFSLGVTMFVLLTGEKPFTGDSLGAISYKIVNDKHPDITQVREGLPKQVKGILDKALHKNPDKRYQSGIVMKRAILRCLKAMGDDANVDGK